MMVLELSRSSTSAAALAGEFLNDAGFTVLKALDPEPAAARAGHHGPYAGRGADAGKRLFAATPAQAVDALRALHVELVIEQRPDLPGDPDAPTYLALPTHLVWVSIPAAASPLPPRTVGLHAAAVGLARIITRAWGRYRLPPMPITAPAPDVTGTAPTDRGGVEVTYGESG